MVDEGAAMTNRDELRLKVALVIADALGEGIHYQRPGFQRAADAAITAYEAHRPRAAVVLTREEWAEAVERGAQAIYGCRNLNLRMGWSTRSQQYKTAYIEDANTVISIAFPWLRVEGE